MLDKNALSQLQSLKQEIRSSVPRFTGRVRATSGRYGFVNTDAGDSYFLAPDEMDKVLPGDRIDFRVESTTEGKEQAIIEKLLSSEITEVFGNYIVRGKGHFIETDHNNLKRWLFVPPNKRMNAKEGDLVRAHISQHPFPSGKTQAAIDAIVGNIADGGVEQRFTAIKWGLSLMFSEAVQQEVKALQNAGLDEVLKQRTDLSHLPFVTIDSASTRDLDDALFAEAQSDGWTLWTAIADPAALVQPGSELDKSALERSTSIYFPDMVLPMLPSELSEQLCSLQAGELRPAMVVELRIGEDGSVRQTHIYQACIRSRAKLSYTQVAQLIDGETTDIAAELHGPLLHLYDCANALLSWRQRHALVMEDRPDFKLVFDAQGKVQDIVMVERTLAHRIVEESMLACNLAVARWLAEQHSGFFSENAGVRSERLADVTELLNAELGVDNLELSTLEGYVSALQHADNSNSKLPLRMIVSRQQERTNFSLQALPHMGLGFDVYTNFSSPLRRYNDLLIHRMVKCLLNDEAAVLPTAEELDQLQTRQNMARAAALQAETWLKLDWLSKHDKTQPFEATVLHINPMGITVRLNETGIDGMIEKRKGSAWSFDSRTLSADFEGAHYQLGQKVQVKVKDIVAQSRVALFVLA